MFSHDPGVMARRSHPWTAYIGVFLAALGLVWSMTSAWFDLVYRVKTIEKKTDFLHGEFDLPKER